MSTVHGMGLEGLMDAFSDLVAAKVAERMAASGGAGCSKARGRLFTVEDAAEYLGRTKEAVQHLVASGKLPTVRSDRRVFLDVKDLDQWIERCKIQ